MGNRSLIVQQTAKEFFRCIVRMSHGRSYLLWDDILTEKLDSLTIDANVKQTGVLTLDTSLEDREESQPSSSQFTCGTCGVQLAGRDEQIEHYKSEEHRHRIKSKLRARFDSLSSVSSASEVDETDYESDDEDIVTSAPIDNGEDKRGRVCQEVHYFNEQDDRVSFFRAMVAGKTEMLDDTEVYKRLLETRKTFQGKGDVQGDRFDAVLLYAAGAFAGAIFVNGEPVFHKVIKKYVCRASQGKAQSTNDLRTHAKSAGAQIRRENEKALMEKIQAQIEAWAESLSKCRSVFVRMPKHQKHVMLGALHQIIDDRHIIRACPCPMHKPRFKEVVRMFNKIFSVKVTRSQPADENECGDAETPVVEEESTNSPVDEEPSTDVVEVEEEEEEVKRVIKKTKKKPKKKKVESSTVTPVKSVDYSELHQTLYTAIIANQQAGLKAALDLVTTTIPSVSSRAKWINEPVTGNDLDQTYLHLAAKNNALNSISFLLNANCDPSKRDRNGDVPFRLCGDRGARAVFWSWRGEMATLMEQPFSKKFWAQSEIPDPTTIIEKTSKKAPRKKKPKAKKVAVLEINNPCSYCQVEIVEVPFKYEDFKFCQMRCLRTHRFDNTK